MLAVNKPAGLTVHPGAGQKNGTLVNALVYRGIHLSDTGGEFRPGIVHRLDKDTSGVILIAKNNRVHRHLSNQLKERSTIKRYLALVWGVPDPPSAVIDAPIGRHPISRKKMAVISTGRPSVTSFDTIKSSNGAIAVKDLSGKFEVDTSNGMVTVERAVGTFQIKTSNGEIQFDGELVAGGDNHFKSSNGSVDMKLQGTLSMELDTSTSNGSITTESPILTTSTAD